MQFFIEEVFARSIILGRDHYSADAISQYLTFLKILGQISDSSGLMPTAFVMISCELGSAEELVTELQKVKGVEEVAMVNGIYDIVAKISGIIMEDL